MQEQYTTAEVAQLIGRSAAHVRSLIKRGDLKAERLPGVGYRVPREAMLSLARETLRDEAGAELSDRRIGELIDQVIDTNAGRIRASVKA